MKKIVALMLSFAMVMSLGVSAMADTITTTTDPGNTSVGTVAVAVTDTTDVVYSVTVEWTDTSVEYESSKGTWSTEDLAYANPTASWKDDTASVSVSNRSNAAVVASIAPNENNTGTTYAFSQNSFELTSAEDGVVDEDVFTITASGTPSGTGNDTFTVTITKPAETIELTLPADFTAFTTKNESVVVTLPAGYTNTTVTYEMDNGVGAACNMTVEAGANANELIVNHGGICGGSGSSTLNVASISDPSVTGSIVINCNV